MAVILVLALVEWGARRWYSPEIGAELVNRVPESLGGLLVGTGAVVNRWLPHAASLDRAAFAGLVGTIAQIAGVFLGLYFTTLGVLASTSYREVPPDLRAVVVGERVGSLYLETVAFAGAAAIYLLGLLSVGYQPGLLNTVAICLAGVAAVLSFIPLGIRAFNFFDPVAVAGHLVTEFTHAATDATPRGFLWNDSSFQAQFNKEAAQALDTLNTLAAITAVGAHPSRPLSGVAKRSMELLRWYTATKADIPPNSYWFERIGYHSSYLTEGGHSLRILAQTGVGMFPKEAPDLLWVERRLIDVLRACLRTLLSTGELKETVAVLQAAQRVTADLAPRLQTDVLELLEKSLLEFVPAAMDRGDPAAGSRPLSDRLLRLGVVDLLFAGPVSSVAALGAMVRELQPEDLREFAIDAAGAGSSDPLGVVTSERMRKTLSFLRGALEFEREVEGKRITPDWFISHHAALTYSQSLVVAFDALLRSAERTYAQPVQQMIAAGEFEAAVTAIERGRETCHKIRFNAGSIAEAIRRLHALRRPFGAAEWPEFDLQDVERRSEELDSALVLQLAAIGPRLSLVPPRGEVPDAFGYVWTVLGQQTFEAILAGHADRVSDLFLPYLRLSMAAHDRAIEEVAERSTEVRAALVADVALDVLELSAYAYLDTHILGRESWPVVQEAWRQVTQEWSDPARIVQRFTALAVVHNNGFGPMTPRLEIRHAWKLAFETLLQTSGVDLPRSGPRRAVGRAASIRDELAEAYADRQGLRPEAHNVFLVALRAEYPEWLDAGSIPRAARELERSAERVKERRKDPREAQRWIDARDVDFGAVRFFGRDEEGDAPPGLDGAAHEEKREDTL